MPSQCIHIKTNGQGLYEITSQVISALDHDLIHSGIAVLFLQHTSAGLIIQENADPTARKDLERWLARLVPEDSSLFSHTSEGPDDMPAHIKATLTGTSLIVPIVDGSLALGTWQGIYLWEHRSAPHKRSIIISIIPD